MKLAHDTPLEVWLRQAPGVERRVGRLAAQRRQIFFEYDPAWLASGPALSPFHLPPRPGLYRDPQHVFEGLPGLCHDSLPDGWGRLLMDRQARKLGLRGLTPLDRLACVGERGMGALVYRPAVSLDAAQGPLDLDVLAHHAAEVLAGEAEDLLVELLRLGGSPAGARPKVLLARVPDGTWTHGEADPPAEHEPWLVKFPARTDPEDIGAVEEAYARMARAAGVEVMPTALFPSATGPGWFGTRRFDRVAGRRVHVHSLSGLLHADHRVPTLDYADLLKATFLLTKDHGEVVRQFRRAVFNVRAHNRDDHSRQFAFVLSDAGDWRLAPAYDLTCADGPGGEHAMLVMGEGAKPTAAHLQALADGAGVPSAAARRIVDEVEGALAEWPRLAREVGVGRALAADIAARFQSR